MLDINLIRERSEWVKQQIARLNDSAPIDDIVGLDRQRREIIQELEELRQERNRSSKLVGQWLGAAKRLEKQFDQESGNEAKETEYRQLLEQIEREKESANRRGIRISELEQQLRDVDSELRSLMLWVPNLPHSSVPFGPDDSHNIIHPHKDEALPAFSFEPKPHWDLGPELDIIDFERGVKLSGSRFYLLKKHGARLQRALIHFMLDFHIKHHGYVEVYPPFMVRSEMFVGAAQLPKFAENIYRDAEEDFMWLGTAEIALTNIHRDEILEEDSLPLNYVAYSPCFRREKMSAGRDVRGIKRGHQFDKVEMYKFTRPDNSYAAFDELVQHASDICEALELPYRLVEMVTGDLGFQAAKKYDIEVWAAGSREWLEVSSISNCEDFQARRANVRYRATGDGKVRYVHTLNGSGLALPRVMIAVLENNQRKDGSVEIPSVLRPFMDGLEVIKKED